MGLGRCVRRSEYTGGEEIGSQGLSIDFWGSLYEVEQYVSERENFMLVKL